MIWINQIRITERATLYYMQMSDALCVEHDAIVIRVNFDKSDVVSDLDN